MERYYDYYELKELEDQDEKIACMMDLFEFYSTSLGSLCNMIYSHNKLKIDEMINNDKDFDFVAISYNINKDQYYIDSEYKLVFIYGKSTDSTLHCLLTSILVLLCDKDAKIEEVIECDNENIIYYRNGYYMEQCLDTLVGRNEFTADFISFQKYFNTVEPIIRYFIKKNEDNNELYNNYIDAYNTFKGENDYE